MAFLSTGSRGDANPYSSRGRWSWGGGAAAGRRKRSPRLALDPRATRLLAAVLCLWIVLILAFLREDPEALDDLRREEEAVKARVRRGRARAAAWLTKERELWRRLRGRGPAATGEGPGRDGKVAKGSEGGGGNVGGNGGGNEKGRRRRHEWDLAQWEDLALRVGPADAPVRVAFATDCDPRRRWKSHAFFLSALRVRQPGRIAQIASGCASHEELRSLREWFEERVAPLSVRFHLHLVPVEAVEGSDFAGPLGLLHWMEYGEGMGLDPDTNLPLRHDAIVVWMDPDQMLLRPITGHFSFPEDIFRGGPAERTSGDNVDMNVTMADGETWFSVRHGRPLAQEYFVRDAWLQRARVAGPDSPAGKIAGTEALRRYQMGPPYLATALDMRRLVVAWCDFAPAMRKDGLRSASTAESHAYALAAAHSGLPHQLVASLMVSDTSLGSREGDGGGEGWAFVDAIPGDEVCPFALYDLDPESRPLPGTLHPCHRYGVGDRAFFATSKVPADFFSCESQLLEEPPTDVGSGRYLYKTPPFLDKKVEYSATTERREAFVLCASIGLLNRMATFHKEKHCGDGKANVEKTIALHDLPE